MGMHAIIDGWCRQAKRPRAGAQGGLLRDAARHAAALVEELDAGLAVGADAHDEPGAALRIGEPDQGVTLLLAGEEALRAATAMSLCEGQHLAADALPIGVVRRAGGAVAHLHQRLDRII